MANTTKSTIEVTGEIEFAYDPESAEFKNSLEAYRESIDQDGDIDDMLKHVAHNIVLSGVETMVDGVGYVGYNGRIPDDEPYSGIMVGKGFDEFEFDIKP